MSPCALRTRTTSQSKVPKTLPGVHPGVMANFSNFDTTDPSETDPSDGLCDEPILYSKQ